MVEAQQLDNSKLDIEITSLNGKTLVSLIPPNYEKKSPADICCVIDTSGSMEDYAKLKNAQGQEENQGLTILDVVKHAVKTII